MIFKKKELQEWLNSIEQDEVEAYILRDTSNNETRVRFVPVPLPRPLNNTTFFYVFADDSDD